MTSMDFSSSSSDSSSSDSSSVGRKRKGWRTGMRVKGREKREKEVGGGKDGRRSRGRGKLLVGDWE